ncbi:MAG: hypothetical protein KIT89_02080 [Microcella sp.]|uniref:hypothetical protein n=1 Tax=Microcella sp. TaxID=1913979 RepID=UPI0024CB6BAB|nr:hypothetical protein [Microcella sp.]UYN84041.1 MAG: hypothetical protein KIT89_02080 [Microcella sp.]
MSDDKNSITDADEQSIMAGGVIRGQVGRGGGEDDELSGSPDDVRSVDESRDEAAGDQDHAAETDDEHDRTQGHV